jgi:CRP-like cAMP-binding protein
MTTSIDTRHPGNALLASLPESELTRLQPHLEIVSCSMSTILMHNDSPVRWVYFPISLIASIVVVERNRMIEAAAVGHEGLVGIPAMSGTRSLLAAVVQIGGDTFRIPAEALLDVLPEVPVLSATIRRYALTQIDEASQNAGCNRTHSLEQRCAKWLLQIQDRVQKDQFPVTHKYLATMLGVRRAGVTIAAGMLQRSRIISYSRGRMTVLDREKLQGAACRCYETIRRSRERAQRADYAGTGARLAAF